MSRASRTLEILMVEDNPADVRLVREVLKELGASSSVAAVASGDAAIEWLRGAPGARPRRPDLIFLDLNLPGMHGRELLSTLKRDAELKVIPVVVLTSSAAPSDIRDCYERWANCYVVKPVDYVGMRSTLSRLESFWREVAELPGSES